eukprot:11962260-Alexandrium_andersonii.AAC.1
MRRTCDSQPTQPGSHLALSDNPKSNLGQPSGRARQTITVERWRYAEEQNTWTGVNDKTQ